VRRHRIWQVNLANRLDPDGTTRDFIDRRIAQVVGYPERSGRDDKAEPPTDNERQRTDG
jgi:hypothetical protein